MCCACKLCYSIVVDLLTQTIIFHVFIFLNNGNIYREYSINLGIVLTSKHIFVCDQKCAKTLHVKLILNVRMFGWPVGDWQSRPRTNHTFPVSPCHLRRVQKIMRKAKSGALEVQRGRNKRLRGLCQQQQVNTLSSFSSCATSV